MTELIKYDAACRAVAEAKSVDEAKDIRDFAIAMKAYARQANNRDLEADAVEIRMRATRRLDHMRQAQKETVGLADGGDAQRARVGKQPELTRPTLASQGIDKNLAHEARQLGAMSDEQFEEKVAEARSQVSRVVRTVVSGSDKAGRRAAREAELGQGIRALPSKRYGVILCDWPRRFNVYSRDTGLDRSPDNHYATQEFDWACRLPVPDLAADDCLLAMWSTAASLQDDLEIMAEWGFVSFRPRGPDGMLLRGPDGQLQHFGNGGSYRSHQIWDKVNIGTGYWFRDRHELLLLSVRGSVPAPAMGSQDHSIFSEKKGEHSAKPEHVPEMLERLFPTVPKVELFRRGPARSGWDVWGHEAQAAE